MDSKEEVETEERKDRTDELLSLRGKKLDDFNYLSAIEHEIIRVEEQLGFALEIAFKGDHNKIEIFTDKTLSLALPTLIKVQDSDDIKKAINELHYNDPQYFEKVMKLPKLMQNPTQETDKLGEPFLSHAFLAFTLAKVSFLTGNIANSLSFLSTTNLSLGAAGFKGVTAKKSELDNIHKRMVSVKFGEKGGAKKNEGYKELRLQFIEAYQEGNFADKDTANEILYKRLRITDVVPGTTRKWLRNVNPKKNT